MDFRGAVLRGWRLLVLLALVGALVGTYMALGCGLGRPVEVLPGGENPAENGILDH